MIVRICVSYYFIISKKKLCLLKIGIVGLLGFLVNFILMFFGMLVNLLYFGFCCLLKLFEDLVSL